MSIPAFDVRGLLPPFIGADAVTADRSPYWSSMSDFSVAFGTSDHRRKLIRNLIEYRALLASDDYANGVQFINGSFVEDVETLGREPGDIDVFSILNAPAKYLADPASWAATGLKFWTDEVVHRDNNKKRYKLDTFGVLYEELLANPQALLSQLIYWYSLFSHQRNTFVWKGFVVLPLNPTDDSAAMTNMGSA